MIIPSILLASFPRQPKSSTRNEPDPGLNQGQVLLAMVSVKRSKSIYLHW
jgi:hypothetical protein